jgi:hypothetical protein
MRTRGASKPNLPRLGGVGEEPLIRIYALPYYTVSQCRGYEGWSTFRKNLFITSSAVTVAGSSETLVCIYGNTSRHISRSSSQKCYSARVKKDKVVPVLNELSTTP